MRHIPRSSHSSRFDHPEYEYRSWRCYHAVCPLPSSSLLHPNLFHIPMFSNALCLCSQSTVPWFLPGRAEEDNEKARLKDYHCNGRDSNMKTTGCRYRINASDLCAVYISSFCRLGCSGLHCLSVLNQRFVCRIQVTWRCVKRSAGRQEGSACCWRREVALSCCEHGATRPTRSMLYHERGGLNLKRTMCACWTWRVHSTHPKNRNYRFVLCSHLRSIQNFFLRNKEPVCFI